VHATQTCSTPPSAHATLLSSRDRFRYIPQPNRRFDLLQQFPYCLSKQRAPRRRGTFHGGSFISTHRTNPSYDALYIGPLLQDRCVVRVRLLARDSSQCNIPTVGCPAPTVNNDSTDLSRTCLTVRLRRQQARLRGMALPRRTHRLALLNCENLRFPGVLDTSMQRVYSL
jgi:hypothetical protein